MTDEQLEEEEQLLSEQRNGNQSEGRYKQLTPSQAQMLIARMGGQQGDAFNVSREFLMTSKLPEEYLARTILTEEELALLNRTTLEMNWAEVGFTDEEESMWVFFGARPSVGGKSREQALEAWTTYKRMQQEERQNWLNQLGRPKPDQQQGNNSQR